MHSTEMNFRLFRFLKVLTYIAFFLQTKSVYVRFFERFGTHVATSAIFGGSIKLEDVVITRLLVDPSEDNIRKQTS